MDYSVKNIKSFQGMEGTGFSCSLYLDNKKIGTVTDTANGGMIDFYFDSVEEENKLDEFCLTLPQWGAEYGDKRYDTDKDIYVTNLVSKFEETKKVKRWCRTKIVFKLDEDKKGSYQIIPHKYTTKIATALREKHEGKGLVIMNELYNQEIKCLIL